MTGGIVIDKDNNNLSDNKPLSGDKKLSDILEDKLGIRTISSFINIWDSITSKKENGTNEQKVFLSNIFNFADTDDKKFIQSKYLFENIVKQGKTMLNNSITTYPIETMTSLSDAKRTDFPTADTDTKQQTAGPAKY